MNPAAIVTLAIGDDHADYWRRFCERSWRDYAQKHNYDLFLITQPLDTSDRATARSPAWQKCLVLSQEFSAKYDQIISLDCDIAINAPEAPNITAQTPLDRVGGVLSGSQIHADLRTVLLTRLLGSPVEYQPGLERWHDFQRQSYRHYGLPPLDSVIQTGVLVASPQHHHSLFESIYEAPEAYRGRCYEQIPLSHALLTQNLFHPIDTRFNAVFHESMCVHYPYLLNKQFLNYDDFALCAVQTELANNFFLHFAYDRTFARYLPPHLLPSNIVQTEIETHK